MPKVKYLKERPDNKLFYLVDSSFLINKYIDPHELSYTDHDHQEKERDRITKSKEWWSIIDRQIRSRKAVVYVLNVCIAESFKALYKHYIKQRINLNVLTRARRNLSKDVTLKPLVAKRKDRHIKFHDIEVNRDIIIGADRFFESFLRNYPRVSTFDLLILSTAKYLIDFYNYDKDILVPVTLDDDLWKGSKKIPDIPYVYDPAQKSNYASKIFK